MYMFTNNIPKASDEHNQTQGLFCDLAKAFDRVNHDVLLDKLLYYGIHGAAMLWFKPYLQNRRQRAEIQHNETGKTFSNRGTIKSGVPQSSVLGLLLFLLHINALP
jgi:hypothetical protein